MDKTVVNFDLEVMERSKDVPVLVDFWSPTCGPCRVLGPVLEKLADEAEGKWELLKINTIYNQEVAMQQQIQSIPHVRLFHKGKVIGEFVGALPEATLRKWLDEFLPTEEKEILSEIRERLMDDGTREAAVEDLKAFVAKYPHVDMGALILANMTMIEDPQQARKYVENIKLGSLLYENAENVRIITELVDFQDDSDAAAATQLGEAAAALKKEDFEQAIKSLIEAVKADKNYAEELPRRGTIAIFNLIGRHHPLVNEYRRQFEMALY